MIELNSQHTVAATAYLAGQLSEWRLLIQLQTQRQMPPISPTVETRARFIKSCKSILSAAQRLGMKASEAAAKRAADESFELFHRQLLDAHALGRLVILAEHLVHVFNDEIDGRTFLVMASSHSAYFSDTQAFGTEVEDVFPAAVFDIAEAAKCRALGRWTASVMHLMRVLEVGLGALAQHYNVSAEANWNQVINQIEMRTREVGRRTHGAEAEQWAAEAATHLRFVKNAWRNHAMHHLEKYDEERAVRIFDSCRDFMQHLAKKVSAERLN